MSLAELKRPVRLAVRAFLALILDIIEEIVVPDLRRHGVAEEEVVARDGVDANTGFGVKGEDCSHEK